MSVKIAFLAVLLVHSASWIEVFSAVNNQPILGVLLQETHDKTEQYVGSSYVKYLESAGARVVPIFINQPASYYQQLVASLNGLLIPGGSNSISTSGYALAADVLLKAAIETNNRGTHFPVWGTCNGFRKVIRYFVGNQDWISNCYVENLSLKLEIETGLEAHSRLFNQTDTSNIVRLLRNYPVTANYQEYCLNVTEFRANHQISANFQLIGSTTYGALSFVSLVEHKHHPIFGSAFFPEKNQFEFVHNAHKGNLNHDWNAIQVGQYFGNFLVNEARKNANHFPNALTESSHLIYNYNSYKVYTGESPLNASFEEVYRFPVHFQVTKL